MDNIKSWKLTHSQTTHFGNCTANSAAKHWDGLMHKHRKGFTYLHSRKFPISIQYM